MAIGMSRSVHEPMLWVPWGSTPVEASSWPYGSPARAAGLRRAAASVLELAHQRRALPTVAKNFMNRIMQDLAGVRGVTMVVVIMMIFFIKMKFVHRFKGRQDYPRKGQPTIGWCIIKINSNVYGSGIGVPAARCLDSHRMTICNMHFTFARESRHCEQGPCWGRDGRCAGPTG